MCVCRIGQVKRVMRCVFEQAIKTVCVCLNISFTTLSSYWCMYVNITKLIVTALESYFTVNYEELVCVKNSPICLYTI